MCRSANRPSVDILGRIIAGRFARAMQFPAGSRRFDRYLSQRGRGHFPEAGTVGHGETPKLREFAASSNLCDACGCGRTLAPSKKDRPKTVFLSAVLMAECLL